MVKKFIVLLTVICIGNHAAEAQKEKLRGRKLVAVPINWQPKKADPEAPKQSPQNQATGSANNRSTPGSLGTQIGKTYYDLQTNGAMGNRLIRHADGTVSAVWNEECSPNTASTGYPNRGAGYNYHNGSTWFHGATPSGAFNGTCNEPAGTNGPQFGIASKRVGWPEIIALRSSKELVFSHSGTGINITFRPTKGTGGMSAWSASTDLPFTQNILAPAQAAVFGNWPRVANAGDSIHMIYTAYKVHPQNIEPVVNGTMHPIVYNRSVDGGLTWDKQNIFLPGLTGITNPAAPGVINPEGFREIGTDNYAIAAKGATVAIVTGDMGHAWTLWKSTDNGTTFTRRVISKITPADTIITNNPADTLAFANDKNHAITIDNNGVVHVFAGQILTKISTRNNGTILLPGESWYPNVGQALLYWNDGMPAGTRPVTIAEIEDSQPVNGFNWIADGFASNKATPYGTTGLVSMPTVAIDNQNNLYVVYAAAVEGTSNTGSPTGQPYRDLYVMKRFANLNGTWSQPRNISRAFYLFPNQPGKSTAENNEESVFPSLAPRIGSDGYFHLIFQKDNEPGMSLGYDLDPETENAIMYLKWNGIAVGIPENQANILNEVNAFPNPSTGQLNLEISLKKAAPVSVKITNLLGQEVAALPVISLSSGQNQLPLDISNLANGIYLYTVTSENFSVTKKLIKQ